VTVPDRSLTLDNITTSTTTGITGLLKGSSGTIRAATSGASNDYLVGSSLSATRNVSTGSVFTYNSATGLITSIRQRLGGGGLTGAGTVSSAVVPFVVWSVSNSKVSSTSTNVTYDTSAGKLATANDITVNSITIGTKGTSTNTIVGNGAGGTVNGTSAIFGYGAAGAVNAVNNITAFGYQAGKDNTTGNSNVYIGYQAGSGNATTSSNVAIRQGTTVAGSSVAIGNNSTAKANSVAINGSANQFGVGINGGTAFNNGACIGYQAGNSLASGASNNYLIGSQAGYSITTAQQNILVGSNTGQNTTGADNIMIGHSSGYSNTTGAQNVFMGSYAGRYISGGGTGASIVNNSICIGYNAFPLASSQTNQIVIGYNTTGNGSNTATIGNSSITANYLMGH
jgi:hypothetical protein